MMAWMLERSLFTQDSSIVILTIVEVESDGVMCWELIFTLYRRCRVGLCIKDRCIPV